MAIYLGTNNIIKMYKGTTEVSKVYLGSNSILEPSSTPTPTPTPSGSFALKMSFDTPFDYTSNRAFTWHMDSATSNMITEADSTFGGVWAGAIKTSSIVKKVGTGSWSEPTLYTGWDNWAYAFFNNSNEQELFADTWFYAPKIMKQMQEVEGYDANNPNIVEEWGSPTDEWAIYPTNRILGFKYNSGVTSFISSLKSNITSTYETPSAISGDAADLVSGGPTLQFIMEPISYGFPDDWDYSRPYDGPIYYAYNLWVEYGNGRWDDNAQYLSIFENHEIQSETWHHAGLYRTSNGNVYILLDGRIYLWSGVTLPNIPNIVSVGASDMIGDSAGSQIGYDEVRVSYINPLTNFNLNTMTYDVPLGE